MSVKKFDLEEKASFKDLQSVLKKNFNENIKIINLNVENFLPVGENYCSTMLKLDVIICKNNSLKNKNLQLIAKTIDQRERPILNWTKAFKKEVFMYAEIIPKYRDFERKMGIEENDLIDVLPKYYGHRYSLNNGNESTIDEDSVLLMENLNVKGFYMCNRRTGLDATHTKEVLLRLARYHAIGIALKLKNPGIFEKIKDHAKIVSQSTSLVDEGFNSILKNVLAEPGYKRHSKIIESSFANFLGGKMFKALPEEPWGTVTHGDLWVNNILFHKDQFGNIDGVKFVDFQIYLYSSPLRDLVFFMCTSIEDNVFLRFLDDLINVYYNSFVDTLKRLNCDLDPFSRIAFDRELKKQAINEFPFAALVSKFSLFNLEDRENIHDELVTNIYDCESSNVYKKKLTNILYVYEKKAWL